MNSQPLQNKVVLVTGGTRGIGKAISRAVHRDGATVIAHYGSSIESAEPLRADLGEKVHLLKSDFNDVRGGNGDES